MNLLLVERGELDGDRVVLSDRRALHLRSVLGATVGSTVRAGIVGGASGTAEITADDGVAITLRLSARSDEHAASEPMPVELVLAIPRPKVLSRALEIAASFAVARITLTNAWRVDKSYLTSPRLEPAALALAARLGAEQGGTTHVAPVAVHRRLMTLLDERFPAMAATDRSALRLIAHPDAPPIEVAMRGGPIVLAIGAEGGWIQREVDTFVERGFRPVSLGAPILRVEAAIAAALAQLTLLARIRER